MGWWATAADQVDCSSGAFRAGWSVASTKDRLLVLKYRKTHKKRKTNFEMGRGTEEEKGCNLNGEQRVGCAVAGTNEVSVYN